MGFTVHNVQKRGKNCKNSQKQVIIMEISALTRKEKKCWAWLSLIISQESQARTKGVQTYVPLG